MAAIAAKLDGEEPVGTGPGVPNGVQNERSPYLVSWLVGLGICLWNFLGRPRGGLAGGGLGAAIVEERPLR